MTEASLHVKTLPLEWEGALTASWSQSSNAFDADYSRGGGVSGGGFAFLKCGATKLCWLYFKNQHLGSAVLVFSDRCVSQHTSNHTDTWWGGLHFWRCRLWFTCDWGGYIRSSCDLKYSAQSSPVGGQEKWSLVWRTWILKLLVNLGKKNDSFNDSFFAFI